MKSMVVRLTRWISIRSSATAACTETSRADTGSSATTTCGAPAKARAMPIRCFCPPESWRGIRRAKALGNFTRSRSSSIRVCRSASDLPTRNFSRTRTIWPPMLWLGLRVSKGFWKTIWIAATVAVPRRSICFWPISRLPRLTLPSVAVSRPRSTLARVDLPHPNSPTIASVSASRASKLTASLAFTTRVSPPKRAFEPTS